MLPLLVTATGSSSEVDQYVRGSFLAKVGAIQVVVFGLGFSRFKGTPQCNVTGRGVKDIRQACPLLLCYTNQFIVLIIKP